MTKLTDKELRAIYDQGYVCSYRRKKGNGKLERLIHLVEFQTHDVVLDLGCGPGFLLDLIQDKIKRYVGIDISDEFIAEATSTHLTIKHASFICVGSNEHSNKTRAVYTHIFIMDVAEHMYDEQLMSMLEDCKGMLKKNGKIYIHTPNRDYFLEYLKEVGVLKQTTGHVCVRNAYQYEEIIRAVGFSDFRICFLNHYVKCLKPFHLLCYLPYIGRFFRARLFIELSNDR